MNFLRRFILKYSIPSSIFLTSLISCFVFADENKPLLQKNMIKIDSTDHGILEEKSVAVTTQMLIRKGSFLNPSYQIGDQTIKPNPLSFSGFEEIIKTSPRAYQKYKHYQWLNRAPLVLYLGLASQSQSQSNSEIIQTIAPMLALQILMGYFADIELDKAVNEYNFKQKDERATSPDSAAIHFEFRKKF